MIFDGATYDPVIDECRLTKALKDVFIIMSDRQWHTLPELASKCCIMETTASARIRDLRKERFGSWEVSTQRNDMGLWQYKLGERKMQLSKQLTLI
jgi:hypothetical protein